MARKKLRSTLIREAREELSEVHHVSPTLVKSLLDRGLDEWLDTLIDEANPDPSEASSIVFETLYDLFSLRIHPIESIDLSYDQWWAVAGRCNDGEQYRMTIAEHELSGMGGDEDYLYEGRISVDGKPLLGETICDSIDIYLDGQDDLIEFASFLDLQPDEVASAFGATIRLTFDGDEEMAKYF